MLSRTKKGRISNELVAASCAAILAVYSAGYWRTRDDARRFGDEAPSRKSPRSPAGGIANQPGSSNAPKLAPVALGAASRSPASPGASSRQLGAVQVRELPVAVASPSSPAALPSVSSVVTGEHPAVESPAKPPEESGQIAVAEQLEAVPPAHKPWLDGYYTGWGQSRHGDIQAFVTIENGQIVNAGIATCETRYPCSVINEILLQPVDLQGPDVDRVSRATESADAYYTGLVRALENAEAGIFRSTRP